ncbi:MAG: HDOD domain-containing protein [Planctomycetes bacterium]|nr:HDOD domain-containing protein [Planctomycetota bacterium]
MSVDIRELIKKVKKLPPLSDSLVELLNIYTQEQVTFEMIGEVVAADASLTLAVLKVANSAELGLNRTITSLSEAVSYLGKRTLMGIAFQMGASDLLTRPLNNYEAEQEALWEHSQYTAIAARELCRYAREPIDVDLAYTAGLVHDIGKVVLNLFMSGNLSQYIHAVEQGEASDFADAERYVLGIDHTEAGMILSTVWRIPQVLRDVIRYHHEPNEAPSEHRCLAVIVQAADIIAQLGGYGTGGDSLLYAYDRSLALHLDIPKEEEQNILVRISREFERSMSSMSMLAAS